MNKLLKGNRMEIELLLHVFRFNANTDYLPYYNHLELEIDPKKKISDVLAEVKNKYVSFSYKRGIPEIKINGVALSEDITIEEALTVFGDEWTLDPFSIHFAVQDMVINDAGFYLKMDTVHDSFDKEDIDTYKSYKPYFYASELMHYNEDYISEAIMAFAADFIQKHPIYEQEVLSDMSDAQNGAWSYTSLEKKVYPYDPLFHEKVKTIRQRLFYQYPLVSKYAKKQSKRIRKSYGFDQQTEKVLEGKNQ